MMIRLLPAQFLLAAVSSVNSIVCSLAAGNLLGAYTMSAVGLYLPVNMFLNAVIAMLQGGTAIQSGKYIGENAREQMQNAFSLNMIVSLLFSAVVTVVFLVLGTFNLTHLVTADPALQDTFGDYLRGQAVGVLPMVVGGQLSAFLSLENRQKVTTAATVSCVIVSLLANLVFLRVLNLGAFGLALSTSVGMWMFFAIQAVGFFGRRNGYRFSLSLHGLRWNDLGTILKVGLPGAVNFGYQAVRGLILNRLILQYAGTDGLSAFAANDALLRLFWAVPFGMVAVGRMAFSVSVGEEDREALKAVMRAVMRRYVPLMVLVSASVILLAHPLTRLYYRNTSDPVYAMTVLGFRILPAAMPISVFTLNYACYGQTSGKLRLVHLLSLMNGLLSVVILSALLLPSMGMAGVDTAHVLSGVLQIIIILVYACIKKRGLPRSLDDLMAFPSDFGVPESEWINLTVRTMEDVISVSRTLEHFCLSRGTDRRRSCFAALAMEEMAGNIVRHGFSGSNSRQEAVIRVTRKGNDLILRIRDNGRYLNPVERLQMMDPEDRVSNVGLRLARRCASEMQYQSILGLNVLTLRI